MTKRDVFEGIGAMRRSGDPDACGREPDDDDEVSLDPAIYPQSRADADHRSGMEDSE